MRPLQDMNRIHLNREMGCRETKARATVVPKEESKARLRRSGDRQDTTESLYPLPSSNPVILQAPDPTASINLSILT